MEFLARNLPSPKEDTGRPAYANGLLLPGILKILRSGSRWRDLDRNDCASGVTHWRRLRFWQRKKGFESLWEYIINRLFKRNVLDLRSASIDGTLIPSFAFREMTSYSGKHHKTGTKVSLTVDSFGLPLSSIQDIGSAHDSPLAIPTIEKIPIKVLSKIRLFLADKGYDNAFLRSYFRNLGIESDIPQRELPLTWKEKMALGDKYRRKNQGSNRQRFVVERTNAWTKSFRRLRFRFDYTAVSFTAFLNLAFCVLCVRKLIS